jgi:hypothetical protein
MNYNGQRSQKTTVTIHMKRQGSHTSKQATSTSHVFQTNPKQMHNDYVRFSGCTLLCSDTKNQNATHNTPVRISEMLIFPKNNHSID